MRNRWGQYYTFEIDSSNDDRFSGFSYETVTAAARTVAIICKNRGHIEDARYVADINGIRNVDSKLRLGRQIRVPDRKTKTLEFNVLAGDTGPRITAGYANIQTIDRSERSGLSIFTGYDPIQMEVPVRFEALLERSFAPPRGGLLEADGFEVEERIAKLEQMAGRGQFSGAAVGQSAIVRVNTTGPPLGGVMPLIPLAYQRYTNNQTGPVWWISGIDWDADALRNDMGYRVRQLATVSLTQYVAPKLEATSAADRNKTGPTKGVDRMVPTKGVNR